MELRINVEYEQVLSLVRQLSPRDKQKLTSEIEKELTSRKGKKKTSETADIKKFRQLLLNGPVMSDSQYKNFKELRESFTNWLEK